MQHLTGTQLQVALGHKQTSAHVRVRSALPLKADIRVTHRHVCLGPKADSCAAANGISHLYSITSSARTSNDGGTVRPSALAVLRLMTNSNFVGCSTGRSEGLVPLSILST